MEEKIKQQLADRIKLLDGLMAETVSYLTNTMFWLIEANGSVDKGKPADVLLREVNLMFVDNMVESYGLVPADEHILRSKVIDLLRQNAIRMELKKFQGKEKSLFNIHTFVVRNEGIDDDPNYVHQVDKFSFTAGMGVKEWARYSVLEQQEIRDFIFDVYYGAGDQTTTMDIKLSNERFTCAFPLKRSVVQEELP